MNIKQCDLCKSVYRPKDTGNQIEVDGTTFKKSNCIIKLDYNYSVLRNGTFFGNFTKRGESFDLCPECADSLQNWIESRVQEQKR